MGNARANMFKRILLYAILGITILLFVAVMSLGSIPSLLDTDSLDALLKELDGDISQKRWQDALNSVDRLEEEWGKHLPKVQFGVDRDEVRNFEQGVVRLKAAIKYEDQVQAEIERVLLIDAIDNLGM